MLENTGSKKRPIVDGWLIFYFLLAAVGLYGMIHVFLYGQEASYGLTRDVSWGLLIIGYALLVGTSTGLSLIVILCHVFGLKKIEIVEKKIIWLALSALLAGFFLIFWDLVAPFKLYVLRFIWNFFPPHITSGIWWMATFYGLEVPLILIEIYLIFTKSEKWILMIGIIGFLVSLSAYSNLGFVFAANIARPFWHGAYIPIFFIVSALGLGGAFSLILCYINQKECKNCPPEEAKKHADAAYTLSKLLFFVVLAIMFFSGWRMGTALYGYQPGLSDAAKALVSGPLAFEFWFFEIVIGLIIPFFILLLSKFKSPNWSLTAAIFIIIGIFFERYDTIVAGALTPVISSYYPHPFYTHYAPSASEITLFISALGVCGFLYLLGDRILSRAGGNNE